MSILSYLVKPLAYVSLPVYLLRKVADISGPGYTRYYIRLTLYLSTLGLVSAWGVVCAVGMSLVGQRFNVNYVVARTFYMLASRAVDIKVVVEGEEHLQNRPAVFIGNHQSMIDILILGRIFPMYISIMAKKSLQWVPFLGQFMTLSGAVFVDRGNNAQAVRSLTAAGENMKARSTSIWLFPEGTRSMRPYPDMLPLKKGAFHTAVNAGVPIVPVVCENYYRLYRKGVFESGTIKVKVLPPIPTEGISSENVGDLAVHVRELMVQALREISDPAPPESSPTTTKVSPNTPTEPSQSQIQDQRKEDPLSVIPSVTEAGDIPPPSPHLDQQQPESRAESRASTNFSEEPPSPAMSRLGESENGVETEEDEGMVLVGRPKP